MLALAEGELAIGAIERKIRKGRKQRRASSLYIHCDFGKKPDGILGF
jgi:hypothetical protein